MPEISPRLSQAHWQRAWQAAGVPGDGAAIHAALIAAWSEPHRRYHTLQHLAECLVHLDAVHQQALAPAEIELALWFHDAIYAIGRSDNEQRSADWARDALSTGGAPADVAGRVHALVMATRHGGDTADAGPVADGLISAADDVRLLLDIDLSILGAPPQRFDEYERQIAQEYASVPEAVRRPRRRAILQGFLERPRIYATAHFFDRCERQARENLAQSIAALTS